MELRGLDYVKRKYCGGGVSIARYRNKCRSAARASRGTMDLCYMAVTPTLTVSEGINRRLGHRPFIYTSFLPATICPMDGPPQLTSSIAAASAIQNQASASSTGP